MSSCFLKTSESWRITTHLNCMVSSGAGFNLEISSFNDKNQFGSMHMNHFNRITDEGWPASYSYALRWSCGAFVNLSLLGHLFSAQRQGFSWRLCPRPKMDKCATIIRHWLTRPSCSHDLDHCFWRIRSTSLHTPTCLLNYMLILLGLALKHEIGDLSLPLTIIPLSLSFQW